ncbi:LysR family transcriptional regulator [Ottowia thiooxydans]|uniref:LysR substrate-binding domain-containing protein n=1 Tax=Ottowia thiooxydans TaxID=219182 RepID=UPI000A06D6FC|nr:LysR family transcriptional regulator [Ottowia thiooxydans]
MDQISSIRSFIRVVESGSFTKAADLLSLPKSSLTKQIQHLEARLKVRLLNRTTRSVTVTPEGAAYYERTLNLLTDLDDFESSMTQANAALSGRLRVDIGASMARLLLIPELPKFFARHPDIQLDLGVSDRPVDLIADNVDCVLRVGPLTDQSLVARRVATVSFLTVAAPGYLQRHGTPSHPRDLETDGHRTINFFSSSTGRVFPHEFIKDHEHLELSGRYQLAVNESNALTSAVLAGLGITQISSFQARPFLADGSLVQLLPEWSHPVLPIHLVYPLSRRTNPRVRAFADWAISLFAERLANKPASTSLPNPKRPIPAAVTLPRQDFQWAELERGALVAEMP